MPFLECPQELTLSAPSAQSLEAVRDQHRSLRERAERYAHYYDYYRQKSIDAERSAARQLSVTTGRLVRHIYDTNQLPTSSTAPQPLLRSNAA